MTSLILRFLLKYQRISPKSVLFQQSTSGSPVQNVSFIIELFVNVLLTRRLPTTRSLVDCVPF